jgi:O-antigen/teichoic acid export membrane protein
MSYSSDAFRMRSLVNLWGNKFFSDTVAYTGSIVLARGLSILIFPLLVSGLNENDLVNYDWALTNIMLTATLCIFGVDSAIGRMLKSEGEDHNQLHSSAFVIILIQTCVTLLFMTFYLQLSEIKLTWTDSCLLIVLLICLIIINQATNTAKWLLERNKVIKIQVSLGVSQAFFLYFIYSIGLLTFSTAIASQMIGALVVVIYCFSRSTAHFSKIDIIQNIKKVFKKSAILGVNTILAGVYIALEKNIIYQSVSAADASIYLIHFKVVTLFTFTMSALQISVVPHMIEILNNRKYEKFILYNCILTISVVTAAVIFFAISPFIFNFFTHTHLINPILMITLLSIQGIVIIITLTETLFIYLEKYKIILLFNTFHIIVFLTSTVFLTNKNAEIITLIALATFVAKLILMFIFNYYNLCKFRLIK